MIRCYKKSCEKPSLRRVCLCFLLEPCCSHVCRVLGLLTWHPKLGIGPSSRLQWSWRMITELWMTWATIRGPALLLLFMSHWSLLLVALSPQGPSSPSLVADAALLLLLRQESRDSESRVWAGLQPLSKVSPEEAFHRSVSHLSLFLTPHPQLELCHHTAPSP